MQQVNFNGYLTVLSVLTPRLNGKHTKNGAPLYRVEAVGTTIIERVYSAQSNQYENIWRELDLTFDDLTENHARVITKDCEVSIFGGTVFSYLIQTGFTTQVGQEIARMAQPELNENVITTQQVIEGLVFALGEKHRANLTKMIPSEKRKTIIQIKPGTWSIRSSSINMQNAQEAEVCISGEV